jgi:hypothetical protein
VERKRMCACERGGGDSCSLAELKVTLPAALEGEGHSRVRGKERQRSNCVEDELHRERSCGGALKNIYVKKNGWVERVRACWCQPVRAAAPAMHVAGSSDNAALSSGAAPLQESTKFPQKSTICRTHSS